jgi:hypothetical protein
VAILRKNGFNAHVKMIIPIVLHPDWEVIPTKIREIQCYDLSKAFISGNSRGKQYSNLFHGLTQNIYSNYKNLEELQRRGLSQGCDSFVLPTEEEATKSWGTKSRRINHGFPLRDT